MFTAEEFLLANEYVILATSMYLEDDNREKAQRRMKEINRLLMLNEEWELTIRYIKNGFLVMSKNHESGMPWVEAITEDGNFYDESEMKANMAMDLCYHVLDEFCLTGSKHDKYRIEVRVIEQHGDED